MHSIDKKIEELKLNLPLMPNPIANYLPYKIENNILYISGQGPILDGKLLYSGKVGVDISVDDGIKASEICCLNIISIIKFATSNNWDNFKCFIKIGGFVNCASNFKDQPKIINGASDLLVKIFGENGKHSRFAVGANALPINMSVEIEAMVALK
ncbi:MAG: hypothetical protein CFH21_01097 [Alphaproteobacteria bacterium MarineAlpha5_Bin11]|nr:hypothetical protein [Pelagibacteraceae bacterium]PPR42496.1 MAG: hypothetical protein CFH21_01097 [Alphaproteobacteria bacterium MarineAlpha5_Bin11]PPR51500.1 MAG: hypothetical protein CFH20_00566 [Alphaproteobacteria bacterium MarineAlpha5_Bin10]|tara:strand:+ start:1268 stop:1732 length:465 start_codon:yes stop_codon:yes gene_type:complete